MIMLPPEKMTSLYQETAKHLGSKIANVERRQFPDGELYLRINDDLKEQKVVVAHSIRTDRDLLDLLLLLDAARAMEPSGITLLVPYFGYARQHTRYNVGEPASSKVIVESIAPYVDSILSVDLHDEETLEYSSKPFTDIKITDSFVAYFKNANITHVISPDDGGFERAQRVAKAMGATPLHLDKRRESGSVVHIIMNEIADIYGKDVLLIDDIISTGGTIMKAIDLLRRRKVNKVYVAAVHGVFCRGSEETIGYSCDGLSVSNSLDTEHSTIDISKELAKAVRSVI